MILSGEKSKLKKWKCQVLFYLQFDLHKLMMTTPVKVESVPVTKGMLIVTLSNKQDSVTTQHQLENGPQVSAVLSDPQPVMITTNDPAPVPSSTQHLIPLTVATQHENLCPLPVAMVTQQVPTTIATQHTPMVMTTRHRKRVATLPHIALVSQHKPPVITPQELVSKTTRGKSKATPHQTSVTIENRNNIPVSSCGSMETGQTPPVTTVTQQEAELALKTVIRYIEANTTLIETHLQV